MDDCQVFNCTDLINAADCYSGEAEPLYGHTKPMAPSVRLMGHYLGPSVSACDLVRNALPESLGLGEFKDHFTTGAGWYKGAAQATQNVLHGIPIAET